MQHVSDDTVLGDFSGIEFDYFGSVSRFFKDGDDYVVRTANASGTDESFVVKWVFGLEPLQQYLVEFPGGRLQALPFAWDTRAASAGGQRWFHLYPDENITPGDELHWTGRQQNWNYMCAECHSTDVVMNYDAASDSYDTRYTELSVGCEACHGPGSTHIAQATADNFANSRYGLAVDLDDQGRAVWSIDPATGIAQRSEMAMAAPQQPESCGRCHARRGIITEHYEYGRPLADTHMPALLDEGLYFADGQIDDEVYVYGSFVQSRMYRAGVTCSNCHNPHSLALVTGPEPSNVCTQCHLPSRFAATEHTGHEPGSAACVDCHMPERTYMVVDDRRDHSFRVPRPDLTVTTGVPNACQNCHADQDAEWASAALTKWHGPSRRAEFASALHAGRSGAGNELLLAAFNNSATPGIARATALGLLVPPIGEAEVGALDDGLNDPDPLVRIAALRLLRSAPPEYRLQVGLQTLADDVLAVRLDAALAYADISETLPAAARANYVEAAAEYRAAQEMILDRPDAWVSLGDFEIASGNFDTGVANYERALAMEPMHLRARINLVDAMRAAGDDARGKRLLEEGLEMAPDNAALHYALGLLFVRAGDQQQALRELRDAARLEPGNRQYRYVLDIALSEFGETVEN